MANGKFGGGSGTIEDPYLIEDIGDFVEIKNNLNSSFKLACNINLGVYPYNIGDGWKPIQNFSGTLDGNHKKIRNLTISRALSDNIGLFGTIILNDEYSNRNFFIKNLMLEDVNISGKNNTGALVGYIEHSPMANIQFRFSGITASGKINAYGRNIGGIVGEIVSNGSTNFNMMCNCISKINVDVKSSICDYIGGMVGLSAGDKTSNSYYDHYMNCYNCFNAGHINKYNFSPSIISAIGYYYNNGSGNYYMYQYWPHSSDNASGLRNISDTISTDGLISIKSNLNTTYATDQELNIPVWNFKAGRLPELICESSDLIFIYDDNIYKVYDFTNNEWVEVSDKEPNLTTAMVHGMKYIDYIPSDGWMALKNPLNAFVYNVVEKRCTAKNNYTKMKLDKESDVDRAIFRTKLTFKNQLDNSILSGIYV